MAEAFEIAGTLVGLLYLYWEYRADRRVWIAGVVMPAISLYVYWQSGLYADFGINVYYLLTALYGLWVWSARDTQSGRVELPVTRTPVRLYLPLLLVTLICFVLLGKLLIAFTDSTVPWWDAFTTALSVVGLWMLARKWVEQWWVWAVVDVVSSGLYIYKGIYFYAILYGLYTVVAIFGYYKWKKLMTGYRR